jgi:hypothetical protein
MMNQQALTSVKNTSGTALEAYRDREEVRELADRLLALHPQAKEVGKEGMFAVAQLAVMLDANALPGTNELHVWKSGGKVLFQLGVNYYRRQARKFGGVLWNISRRQMSEGERAEYGIPNGQIAAIAKGARASDIEKYMGMGFPANQIWEMVGFTGIGVCGSNEAKNGRPPVWTALKRAEVDAYRGLFPELGRQIGDAGATAGIDMHSDPITDEEDEQWNADLFDWGGSEDTAVISHPVSTRSEDESVITVSNSTDGDYTEIYVPDNIAGYRIGDTVLVQGRDSQKPGTVTALNFPELVSVRVEGNGVVSVKADRLSHDSAETVDWDELESANPNHGVRTAEQVRAALVEAALNGSENAASEKQIKFANSSLNSATNGDEAKRKAFWKLVFGIDSSKDATGGMASATIDWLGAGKDNDYTPVDTAVRELERIYTAFLKAEGQQQLI